MRCCVGRFSFLKTHKTPKIKTTFIYPHNHIRITSKNKSSVIPENQYEPISKHHCTSFISHMKYVLESTKAEFCGLRHFITVK